MQPAVQAALLALGVLPPTRNIGKPSGQIHLTRLNQGYHHPQAGGQMAQMCPFTGLTYPALQGIVEARVFFTAF